MIDYRDIVLEYKNLQSMIENHSNDLSLIQKKINLFNKNISLLKDEIIKIPDIKDDSFSFLNPIIKKFVKSLQINITNFNDYIIGPLDSFIYSYNFATSKNLTQLSEIKNDLFEGKKNLTTKRDIYFNYMNETSQNVDETINEKNFLSQNINNNISSKKDENILNNAMKDNYAQLYQYELNKMNEIIEESNTKYNNLYHEINGVSASLNLTIKDCLTKFANNLSNFGDSFKILSEDLIKKIESLKLFDNEEISKSSGKVSNSKKPRFEKEIFEQFNLKQTKKKFDVNSNINEKKGLFDFFRKRKSTANPNIDLSKIIQGDIPFESISKVEEQKENNKKFMEEIIKNLVEEQEIKSKEISNIFNILNESNGKSKKAILFLKLLKKYYNNRVISFKNKNNFIHLSNIMNDLCLKHQKNNNIINLIIEVSQMIKYKNDYIYKIIQKKNEFFSTKTLWIQLIDNNFIESLNKYTENILSKKIEEKNNLKENEDEKNIILEKIGLNKKIMNYKRLKNNQKRELDQYAKEKICIILSKNISGMCCFLVPERVINEIIIYYSTQFKFEYEIKCYLKNKMTVKNMKIIHQIKLCPDKEEKLNNKVICISSVSKFFQIKNYPLLLKLNKDVYPKLKKNIFLNLISDKNLSIDSHLLLWREYLKINEIKEKIKYKDTKEKIFISEDKGQITEEIREKKNIDIIEKDVSRTLFVQKNKSHFNNLKSILISFLFLFPKTGYCQGMNCVTSFLYQLLDYNEEETFYFLCGFMLNTKYYEIFEDNFETLKTYFIIFEKILNINRPEIYYKFMDNNLMTNAYMSPWFITLFTDFVFIFEKNNPPKFVFFIIEKFIIEGWSVIFNCGFTLLEYCYEKIMILEKDKLISYVMKILENEEILKNENFEKAKELYMKNSKLINEFFIDKLIEITKYEEKNKYLNENINLIGNNNK